MRGFMRKCGKFLLLAILAIVLIATLVACNFNESSQSGGGTGSGGGQGTGGGNVPVAETKPYGLEFEVLKGSSAFDKAVVSEFDLSRDVLAYITMQTGTERPVRGQQITLTEDMVAAEDRANLHKAYSGQIAVSYDYEGTTLTGKFTIHLQAGVAESVPVTVNIGTDASFAGSNVQRTDTPGVWTFNAGIGTEFTYEEFVSTYKLLAPKGQALDRYVYGDDGGEVFAAGGTLTVTKGLSLTAEYSSTAVTVKFDLNAPADCWTEAKDDPASVDVAPNSTVPRPAAQDYASSKYTLLGWSTVRDDTTTMWSFSKRLSAQTDVRDTLTLYGVWGLKSATVGFDLAKGTFVTSLDGIEGLTTGAELDALTEAIADVSYAEDTGRVRSLTLRGITFDTSLDAYRVTMALTEDADPVTFAVKDIAKLITKGEGVYDCTGLFLDAAHNKDWLEVISEDKATVYIGWDLVFEGGEPGADYYAAAYEFIEKADNTYAISVRDTSAEVFYIPAEYNGKKVTEIAADAFNSMSGVSKVDFTYAKDTLTTIGARAFFSCTSLTELVGIEDLTALTSVGEDALYGTAWMNAATEGNDIVAGKVLVRYMGEYGTGDVLDLTTASYEYIAPYAFSDYKPTDIKLPATVKGIGENAFNGLTVGSVEVAEGCNIAYIAASAFEGTPFLANATSHVIVGNVFYRAVESVLQADSGKVTIPEGVNVVAASAFAGTSLAEVTLAEGADIISAGERTLNGTPYLKNDADDFVILGSVLVSYTGSDTTVVVPDEVKYVAPGAFGKTVKHVIFRSTSEIAGIADYAFSRATALELVAIYADSLDVEAFAAAPYAFADATGRKAVNDIFKVSMDSAQMNAVDAAAAGAFSYLKAAGRVKATEYATTTSPVALNTSVFVSDYVASADGTFNQYDFAEAWGGAEVTDDPSHALVVSGILVTRDGITIGEDYPVTLEEVTAGLNTARASSAGAHTATGEIALTYDGFGLTLRYNIHAAIDEASIKLDDTYLRDASGKLKFFNSQIDFDRSGSMTYSYITLKVGTEGAEKVIGTWGDGITDEVPMNSSDVTVSGYDYSVGVYPGGLTVSYDYYGTTVSNTFDFVVAARKAVRLEQISTAVMPLGSSAADFNSEIKFNIIYDDGTVIPSDLRNADITSVGGEYRDTLDTTVPGVHSAEISYYERGSGTLTCTIVYAVELVPLNELYTFALNDEGTGAVITGTTAQRALYVLPDTATVNDTAYPVVAIGENAFKGNTRLTTVYIPRGITEIDNGAFEGCTSLTQVLGFQYDDEKVDADALDFGDFRILTEEREGTATIAITDINDYALSEDVITIPHLGVYSGVISDFSSEVQATLYENAVVTANYELVFTLDADTATAIAEKLADYVGTVRLPATAGADGALAVVEGFKDLYDKLAAKGLTLELYDDTPFGIEELYGRVTVAAEALATVDYTAKGTVIFTGALSGDIAYIPATVKNGENREYTVTALAKGTLLGVANADAIYIPASVVTFEGGLEGVFGGTYSADIYMYDAGADLVRPHSSASTVAMLPAGIEKIGDNAFAGCKLLNVDFTGATALTEIGDNAFEGCTMIDKVEFSADSALTKIGKEAFMDSGVTVVDLGGTAVSEIMLSAFEGGKMLSELVLPAATLEIIGDNAFAGCEELASVTFDGEGAHIEYIGNFAFHNCAFDRAVFDTHKAEEGCTVADNAFDNCAARA